MPQGQRAGKAAGRQGGRTGGGRGKGPLSIPGKGPLAVEYTWLPLGFAVAVLGAMVGVGGGLVFVPALIYIYGFPHPQAAGTSLAVVTLSAAAATLGYWREGKIVAAGGVRFALAGIPGSLLGVYASAHIPASAFRAAFAAILLLLAAILVRNQAASVTGPWRRLWRVVPLGPVRRRRLRTAAGEEYRFLANENLGVVAATAAAFVGGLLGIGGGILLVPAMLYLVGYPPQVAAATAQLTVFSNAVVGAAAHAWSGHVDWHAVLLLGLGASLGGPAGVRLARRVNGRVLMLLLALLLAASAVRMLW